MIDVDTIVRTLAPAVSELGLELYDVQVSGSGRARILRVMVDREGGVDLEAIADATQAVSPLLDAPPLDDAISGPYALEVSSPGLERPLRTPAHFVAAVGTLVSVKTNARVDGERRIKGTLVAADDDGITVGDRTLQYSEIEKARTVFEWGPTPKPGTTKPAADKKKAKASS